MQTPGKLELEFAELSDIGLRRRNNQDSLAIATAASEENWQRRGHLFVVADGMGAHAAGELASKIAAETIPHSYLKHQDAPPAEAIRQALHESNHRIHERGQANAEFRGMGTTASVLLLIPQGAVVAHVGDSRVYRLRGETLEQLSFDHSLVWETMASAKMTAEEVPPLIPKNIITRSLGPNSNVQVDLEGPFPVQGGDTFLLCSDGLSGPINDEELGSLLRCLSPAEAVRVLVDLANLRGGADNITVIVIRVVEGGAESAVAGSGKSAGASKPSDHRLITTAAWTVLLIASILGIACAFINRMALALGCGVAALAAAAVLLAERIAVPSEPNAGADELPHGNGPYTSTECPVRGEFVQQLARTVRELREAASEEHWEIDWEQFNALDQEAVAAAKQGEFLDAARSFSRAISFMMQQLRTQNERHGGEGSDA